MERVKVANLPFARGTEMEQHCKTLLT